MCAAAVRAAAARAAAVRAALRGVLRCSAALARDHSPPIARPLRWEPRVVPGLRDMLGHACHCCDPHLRKGHDSFSLCPVPISVRAGVLRAAADMITLEQTDT